MTTSPARPTITMVTRNAVGEMRRPIRAPTSPPTSEESAINRTARQSMRSKAKTR